MPTNKRLRLLSEKCENLPSKQVEKCESNNFKSLQYVTAFLLQYRILYRIVYG